MKRQIVFLLIVILVLFSIAAEPQDEGDVWKVTVINHTLNNVVVEMEGVGIYKADPDDAVDYEFTAKANTSTSISVTEDEYYFTYESCPGSVDVKGDKVYVEDGDPFGTLGNTDSFLVEEDITIELQPCEGQHVQTNLLVHSHIDQNDIDLNLTSLKDSGLDKEDYTLKVDLGNNKFTNLWSGEYAYSFEVCDLTFTGTMKIEKNGSSTFTIKSCERYTFEAADPQGRNPNPAKFRVNNNFSVPVTVTFVGPLTQWDTFNPGSTRVELVPGTYQYIYAAHGRRYEGAFVVPRNGSGFLSIPYFISEKVQ